jgi:hypothetical protein
LVKNYWHTALIGFVERYFNLGLPDLARFDTFVWLTPSADSSSGSSFLCLFQPGPAQKSQTLLRLRTSRSSVAR